MQLGRNLGGPQVGAMTAIKKNPPASMVCLRAVLTVLLIVALPALSACSYSEDMWSSVTGDDDTTPPPAKPKAKPGKVSAKPLPGATTTSASYRLTEPVPPGPSSGTFVGQKITGLRADLERLTQSINAHDGALQRVRATLAADANRYFTVVGGINSRLQVGTTRGNPELVAQFNRAQTLLDRMNDDISGLNALSTASAGDLALAAYLLQEIKAAFALQGAVDEDHRQLNALEAAVNGDVPVIQQMMRTVTDDLTRQNSYITNERRNLAALDLAIKNGELYGQSFASRSSALLAAAGSVPAYASAKPERIAHRRPLVTIRFDRPDVPYERPLYNAISHALDRRPSAVFDLVAVSPSAGSAAQVTINADEAKRNAENVMRSLAQMGLPASRLAVSATTSRSVKTGEVRIYVR